MNRYIFMLAIVFGFIKNQHFGWNMQPESSIELICDGIMLIIFSLSLIGKGK